MIISLDYCRRLCDFIVGCDAALLELDFLQWCMPYAEPEYQKVLPRILQLHSYRRDDEETNSASLEAAIARAKQVFHKALLKQNAALLEQNS
jgi:hypothetical protein